MNRLRTRLSINTTSPPPHKPLTFMEVEGGGLYVCRTRDFIVNKPLVDAWIDKGALRVPKGWKMVHSRR